MAQSSDAANRKQKAEQDQRDAEARMKADRQSSRPVKGNDVGEAAKAAFRRGKAEAELAIENDRKRGGKRKR